MILVRMPHADGINGLHEMGLVAGSHAAEQLVKGCVGGNHETVITPTVVVVVGNGTGLGVNMPGAELHGFQHKLIFNVILLDLGQLSQLRLQFFAHSALVE
jgi:hypothetical protein